MKQQDGQRGNWLRSLVEGKGFYVVMLTCVVTVGITGLVMMQQPSQQPVDTSLQQPAMASPQTEEQSPAEPSTTVPASQEPESQPSPEQQPEPAEPSGEPQPSETEVSPVSEPSQEAQPVMQQEEEEITLYRPPVTGAIARMHTDGVLQYDKTMGDYRTHNGVDLHAELGTEVLACAEGTVTDLYEDPLLGVTLVVDHGNGIQSKYANLDPQTLVQPGDVVERGQALALVGQSALGECREESHLHFEMWEAGLCCDPARFVKFQQ
ncbi:MAG: peptidoglycan DD-metalloendopeptidase family protein [Eubacteriales bacterium]|jgi:murein DD-endopeptidase MepM/ murein hydrolase activator NlpD